MTLRGELQRAEDFLVDGKFTEAGLEVIVEVEHLLERLYECPWGEGECLKRVAVAVQAQVNNAWWTQSHVDFLRRRRWPVASSVLDQRGGDS